jgi:hypothetical protein
VNSKRIGRPRATAKDSRRSNPDAGRKFKAAEDASAPERISAPQAFMKERKTTGKKLAAIIESPQAAPVTGAATSFSILHQSSWLCRVEGHATLSLTSTVASHAVFRFKLCSCCR